MKTIDLNKQLLGLDGTDLEDVNANAGKLLAQALASSTKGDALKMWSIATRLYSGEKIELDASDLTMLKTFVTQNETITILAKSQLLTLLGE